MLCRESSSHAFFANIKATCASPISKIPAKTQANDVIFHSNKVLYLFKAKFYRISVSLVDLTYDFYENISKAISHKVDAHAQASLYSLHRVQLV